MGYRGRGYLRNKDMEVDASGASHGQFIWTRRGDDEVTGSDHRDVIFTGRGDDTVEGGGGNDVMFGGRGTDTAVFSGSVLDYNVLSFGCGRWNLVQGADGCDFLHSFEVLQFDDFTLDLRANNDPLVVLRDDGLETSQGEPLSFQVDFYDIDGSSVELLSASVTGSGTLTTQNSGVSQVGQMGVGGGTTVSFDPGNAYDSLGAGESTTETVTLTISDGQGGTTTVTYEITIEGQNDAPLALAVSATATEDSPVVVAANYSDIDANDTHSFTIDITGTLGTVTNNGDGTFSYDPAAAFDGLAVGESATDTFTYTVDDGNGGTSTETVTVTIQGQNDAPVAMAVSDTSDEDGPAITVSADFSDVDASDTFTFSVDTTGTLGTVTNNGDGTFNYDPSGAFESLAVGETATDTFTYTVDDGKGGTATETVAISVQGTNDAPMAAAITASTHEDGPAITIAADVTDPDASDTHTFTVDTTGTLGSVVNNGDGTFAYSAVGAFDNLAVGETATDTFTYMVDDGNGGTATETVTVTVTGQNDAPIAEAVVGEVAEDSATFSSASIGAYTIPNYGRFYVYDFDTGTAVSIARDGGANNTYDQLAAQYLSDGNGIVMQANPNNEGWGFAAVAYVDGVGDFIDASTFNVIGGNGDVDRSNGDWIEFGDSNENIESIEFDIVGLDLGDGYSVDAQISIGPLDYEYFTTDDLRVDGAQFSSSINGPSPSVTVAADVSDPDSDTFVFTVNDTGTVGSVINNGDGTFTYSADGMFEYLNTGETATDSFAYTVDDGAGGLDTEIVTITITGSDDFLFA
ncbi:Ig-like domain-containing protein [Thalassobius sp. MITS945101]|uniref:Ig-like domain-containing protein n=1 Tax=Thalassobius sp. MITS945101 TaxID=3096994 RepID=UPI003999EAE0